MPLKYLLLLIAILFTSLISSAQKRTYSKADSLFVFNSTISKKLKQKMMDSSFANESTSPNFVVITAVNKITGKIKEICTQAPFVIGGIEQNKGNAAKQNYKSTSLYFNTKAALDNVGFDEYTYQELIKYGQNKELKAIVHYLLRNPMVTMEHNFQGTRKQQFMFAHVLFNNGIMSTSGCIAGNLMTLKKLE